MQRRNKDPGVAASSVRVKSVTGGRPASVDMTYIFIAMDSTSECYRKRGRVDVFGKWTSAIESRSVSPATPDIAGHLYSGGGIWVPEGGDSKTEANRQ